MRRLRSRLRAIGAEPPPRSLRLLLLLALLLSVTSLAARGVTLATFDSSASQSNHSIATASLSLSDNDSGSALLSFSDYTPGSTKTGCLAVTYSGGESATVRLYGTVSGSLAQYLTLKVTRGTETSPSSSCTSFTADETDYNGDGAGVVYSGLLSGFPTSYGAGVVDPTSGSPETWSDSEAHSYRLEVTLANDDAAQGLSATAGFTWEARGQ